MTARWYSAIVTLFCSQLAAASVANGQPEINPCKDHVSVLTQHNDNFRTGANLNEKCLNVTRVKSRAFGKLFTLLVDGQVYAQPLYVGNIAIPGRVALDVLYVATMHNSVYAFDAVRGGEPLWTVSLGRSVPSNFMDMSPGVASALGVHNIRREIGIVSTPVIDRTTSTIYVVAKTCDEDRSHKCKLEDKDHFSYRLHALDLQTGAEKPKSPVQIRAMVRGTGSGKQNGEIEFDAARQLQRAGLLLSNGLVYVAFGSHQDTVPYHGWLIAYDSKPLDRVATFCATANGLDGGIWQAGNAPAADEHGNVYVMTGNGTVDIGRQDYGMSFLKLSPHLEYLESYTPDNWQELNDADIDLGSSGPLILPDNGLVVGGSKEGVIYVVRFSGDSQSSKGTRLTQRFQVGRLPHQLPKPFTVLGYSHIHGSPVFWNSESHGPLIYVWPEHSPLRAFQFDSTTGLFGDTSPPGNKPTATMESKRTAPPNSMPGGMLSLSSNSRLTGTGIVWATVPIHGDAFGFTVPGVLVAFDADTLTEIWSSEPHRHDRLGMFAKFSPPTIANGRVYVGTFTVVKHRNPCCEVVVYGLGE